MIKNGFASLFDPDSFVQTFAYAGDPEKTGDGVLTGYGALNGRLVFAAFQDRAFLNGSVGRVHASKIAKTISMAIRHGAPFLFFLDTAGARLSEGLDALCGYGEIMRALSEALGQIPTVCIVNGDCFGSAAMLAALCDFVLMTEKDARLSVCTPGSLKESGKLAVTENAFDPAVNAANGLCALTAPDADSLYEKLKALVSFLPDSAESGTDDYDGSTDDGNRPCPYCASLKADTVYDVRDVLGEIADDNAFLEIFPAFAGNMITAFARFGGRVTAVLANQSTVSDGLLSADACRKASSVLDFCDRFGIPVLTLTNCAGFVAAAEEEKKGLAAAGATLAASFANARVPKLNLIIGKAYGSAAVLMNSRQLGADYAYAWNSAQICIAPPEVGALMESRGEIASAEDPRAARETAIAQYKAQCADPIFAAAKGFADDIIAPVQTRARIISIFQMM